MFLVFFFVSLHKSLYMDNNINLLGKRYVAYDIANMPFNNIQLDYVVLRENDKNKDRKNLEFEIKGKEELEEYIAETTKDLNICCTKKLEHLKFDKWKVERKKDKTNLDKEFLSHFLFYQMTIENFWKVNLDILNFYLNTICKK